MDNELREEIRKLIREELLLIILEDKKLKLSLETYLKSMLGSEIKYLKMIEDGFQKSDQEVTLQLDSNNLKLGAAGWINYEEIDEKHLKNVHEQLISNEFTDTDFEDFSDIIMNRSIKKINWIQRMSKDKNTINSYGIFDLLYSLDFSIINLKGTRLRWFIFSVLRKFSENGDNFTFERIYDSFSKWKNLKIQNN